MKLNIRSTLRRAQQRWVSDLYQYGDETHSKTQPAALSNPLFLSVEDQQYSKRKQYSNLIELNVTFVTFHTCPPHTVLSTLFLPLCLQTHHERPLIPLPAKARVGVEGTTTPKSRPTPYQCLTGMPSANRYPILPPSLSATQPVHG
jgi:hypothetical protein